MPLDIKQLLADHRGENYELFSQHVSPRLAKVLQIIGFDRCYVRAEGAHLWDVEGRQYLDMLGGYAVMNAGRNHPDIKRAITDFLDEDYSTLVQMDGPLLAGLLARELVALMPHDGLDTVFFTNSGAEGIETAIKYARCATGKPAIVHCEKAFHGLSTGALALNGDESFREGFAPYLPGCRSVPYDDLPALERALSAGDVAGFVVEPIQGKGVNMPSPGYLAEAASLCKQHGALFIDDEVQAGMGRTGKFLAIEHEAGVEPDIVVMAKALSGGFVPCGAVIARRAIYDKVFSSLDRAVVHSSTFGRGSLAMVAGLASLKVLDEYDLAGNAHRRGKQIMDGLEAMQSRFEFMRSPRGRGLMIGIPFGPPRSIGLKAAWSMIHTMDPNLFAQAVTIPMLDDHRVLTQVAGHHMDVVKLIPPLLLSDDDVAWFLRAFEAVMIDLHKFPGPVWEVLKKLGKHAMTKRATAAKA